ncbi:MAG: SNF2 helicase associated domain-containing protein, partial [Lachnospiraceae bacterium]|nr:SNF2 helicase associated domain-containing protein [Lachnospiraceae bacterium]
MMELKDYFRSFSEDELVKGAELFFSGALEDLIRKNGYDVAKNPKADPAPVLKRFPEREVTFISAKWRLKELNKKEVSMDCCLRIVPEKKLVCESFCMCEDFHRDHYGCAHVAALLTSYMVDENGENIFKGTRIEERLCSITGTEDPFAPGALKRTDERLLSLLEVNSERALPSFNRDVIQSEPVKVIVRLRCEGGRKYIGLKAGLSKRMYLVQSLGTFLDAYRNEHLYFFGKKEARLGRVYMEEHSARIAGFLADIYSASEKGLLRGNIFASEGGHSDKYMLLTGSEFDSFMELLDGMKLEDANDEMEYPVCLDKKGLKARVRKKAYGAALKVEDSELLCINGDNLYLKDDECIFRVRTQNARKRQELLSLLDWTDELYIRDSELAAVCRNLLPVFEEYGELTVTGMELSDYMSEIPDFVFKLDYTDEGLLTCDPIAVYGKQDFQCPLFDSKAEAGKRDPEAEGAAAVTLQNIFSHLDKNGHMLYSELSEEELFDFMKDYLPVLEKLGKVMATERLKRNRIRKLPAVAVGVSVEKGDMLLSLKSPGLSQFEMADILGAYRKRKRYYRLRSGEFISMEGEGDETWGTISELFGEYGKKDPESFKVPLFRALYLNEMLE